MKRRLNRNRNTKQDLLAKSFSLPTLSTVEYSSGYLLFISCSKICLWIDWFSTTENTSAVAGYPHVYITRNFKGLDSREITSLPEIKNVMRTWRVISIIAENKPHAHHNSQFPRSPLGTPGTMTSLCILNTKKNGLQIMSLAAYASETNNGDI